jgi:hypothetical protein
VVTSENITHRRNWKAQRWLRNVKAWQAERWLWTAASGSGQRGYIALALFTILAIFVLTLGIMSVARRGTSAAASFATYQLLQFDQSSSVLVKDGFTCAETDSSSITRYCVLRLETGVISQIDVFVVDEAIVQMHLRLRDHRITLGELVLLWGQPHLHFFGQTAYLSWPQNYVTTTLSTEGAINYFLPVASLSFADPCCSIASWR